MSKEKIKIAIVAPPFGETGGPEVVVKNLSEALTELGVDVTLFAPADWKVKCKHVATLKQSLWNMKNFKSTSRSERSNLAIASQIKILNYQNKFDLIHLNYQRYALAIAKNLNKPVVLTLHNRIPSETFQILKKEKINCVAISKLNKSDYPVKVIIHNGLPVEKTPFNLENNQEYLIAIGRLQEIKGVDIAIKLARLAKKKLIILGRVGIGKEGLKYFEEKIKPHIDNENIVHIEEVKHDKVYDYLKNASALVFTPRWEEPFGMVVVEALATGTPVIGYPSGGVKEIITDKRIGLLSYDEKKLVEAIKNTDQFDRKACREHAEKYFDSKIMAEKYLKLYREILGKMSF